MIQLSTSQTALVADYLAEASIKTALKEDLLDHLCCEIEAAMAEGQTFYQAYTTTTTNWQTSRLRKIDRQILFTTKIKPMLIKFSGLATVVAAIAFLSPNTSVDTVQTASEEPIITQQHDQQTSSAAGTEANHHASHVALEEVELLLLDPAFDPPSASPLRGVVLTDAHSGFGKRRHPISKRILMHKGIDFPASLGTEVLATADGEVIFAGDHGPDGIQVVIQHADGYSTAYNHLQSHLVKPGQQVKLGQVIAAVGSTGQSTGPHLHYEVRKDGQAVNPLASL